MLTRGRIARAPAGRAADSCRSFTAALFETRGVLLFTQEFIIDFRFDYDDPVIRPLLAPPAELQQHE